MAVITSISKMKSTDNVAQTNNSVYEKSSKSINREIGTSSGLERSVAPHVGGNIDIRL